MSAADEQGEERATRKSAPDLRLPGSVAEILASPAGPKVGAFFDLDGTLVAGFTAVILTQERLRRRDMGVGELLGMVQAGLNHTLGRIEFEDLIGKAAAALAGRLVTLRPLPGATPAAAGCRNPLPVPDEGCTRHSRRRQRRHRIRATALWQPQHR